MRQHVRKLRCQIVPVLCSGVVPVPVLLVVCPWRALITLPSADAEWCVSVSVEAELNGRQGCHTRPID